MTSGPRLRTPSYQSASAPTTHWHASTCNKSQNMSTISDKLKPIMDQPNTVGFSLVEYNPPQRWLFLHQKMFFLMSRLLNVILRFWRMRGANQPEESEEEEFSECSVIHDIFPPKVNSNTVRIESKSWYETQEKCKIRKLEALLIELNERTNFLIHICI